MERTKKRAIIALAVLMGVPLPTAAANRWQLGGKQGHDWGDWTLVNTMVDIEASPGSIQPFELHPEENILPMLGPWARWRHPRDPLWRPGMPRIWRFHQDIATAFDWDPRLLLDGDAYTGMAARNYGTQRVCWEYYTLDLGTAVPLERYVFYPKEGVDELTGEPYRPGFALRNFEVSAGHETELSTVVNQNAYAPLSVLIAQVENNFEFEAEVRFPLQYFRLFRHRPHSDGGRFAPDCASWPNVSRIKPPHLPRQQPRYGLGELELYGRGFVPQATWESRVVDLEDVSNVGPVHFGVSGWGKEGDEYAEAATAPIGALVEIKTGLDDTPTIYYTYNQMGKLVESPLNEYATTLKTKQYPWHPNGVGWRGPISEDTDAWSLWTASLESGIRPKLRRGRYLKVRVRLQTQSLWEFARMESLVVVTSPVLAERILGEVAVAGKPEPEGNVAQVPAGEEIEFIYEMRAEFSSSAQSGFDAVRVSPPSKARYLALEMGDPPAAAEPDSVVEEDLGFAVYLPRRIEAAGDIRLRLRLQTRLYDAAAEVPAEAFERSGESLPQAVEPGDAAAEVSTNQLRVLALPSSLDEVLGAIAVMPPTLTPQGDGINDEVLLTYTLFSVRSTQVQVAVYGLDGRRIRQLYSGLHSAGRKTQTWDGRDGQGALVAPGLYLLRVEVDANSGRFARLHPVAVAY